MLRMNHVAGMLVLVGAIVAGCSSNHLPTPPKEKQSSPANQRPSQELDLSRSQGLEPAISISAPGTLRVVEFSPAEGRTLLGKDPKRNPRLGVRPTQASEKRSFQKASDRIQSVEDGPSPLLPPPDNEVDCTAESWINPDPNRPDYFYHGSRSVTDQPISYIAVEHWLYMNGDPVEYGYREKYNDYLAGIWQHDPDDYPNQQFWEVYGRHHFVDDAYGMNWHPLTYPYLYH